MHYPPRIPEFDEIICKPLLESYEKKFAKAAALQTASAIQHPSYLPLPYILPHPMEPGKRRHTHLSSDDESSDISPIKKRKKTRHIDTSFSSNETPSRSVLQALSLSPLLTWCKQYRGNYAE